MPRTAASALSPIAVIGTAFLYALWLHDKGLVATEEGMVVASTLHEYPQTHYSPLASRRFRHWTTMQVLVRNADP